MWSVPYLEAIATSLSRRTGYESNQLPMALFHYTSLPGVIGIGSSMVIRATCIADLADTSELSFGAAIVRQECRKKIDRGIDKFARMVVELIPDLLLDRAGWTFITCFCPDTQSNHHWETFGAFGLRIETLGDWIPDLKPETMSAQVRYHKVLYQEAAQRRCVRETLDVACNGFGKAGSSADSPWAPSTARFFARNISQLLMGVVSSFKQPQFRAEKEWRIICGPNPELRNSDPGASDGWFRSLIKGPESRRYVELCKTAYHLKNGRGARQMPFNAIHCSRTAKSDTVQIEPIRDMLSASGCAGISII